MKNLILLTTAILFLSIAGCGQQETIGGPLSSITIEPLSAMLLTGTTTQFIATGRDSKGNEVPLYGSFNVYTITVSGEGEIAEVESQGSTGDKLYGDIFATDTGTGEVIVTSGSVHGSAAIAVIIGTIEAIHVAADRSMPILNDETVTFIATGEDEGSNLLYITPTWEVIGSVVTIESTSGNTATLRAIHIGLSTVEAFFGGKMGSAEVWVTGTVTADASSYVDAGDDTPHGDQDYLKVAYYPGTASTKESYIKFDLSNVPPDTTINSAVLTLTIYTKNISGESVSITCHKVTGSWSESTIKWSIKPSYDSTPLDDTTVSSASTSVSFNIKTTVQDWVNNPSTNYGIVIVNKPDGGQSEITFWRRIGDEAKRPKLTVSLTP